MAGKPDWDKAWQGLFGGLSKGAGRYGEGILEERREVAKRKYEQETYERKKKIDWKYATEKRRLEEEYKVKDNLYKLSVDPKALPRMKEPAMELYQKKDPMSPEHKHLWNQIYNSIRLSKPAPRTGTGKYTMSDLKLNIALKYIRKEKLTEEEDRILFSPSLMEQFFGGMGGQMGQGQSGERPPLSELLK